VYAVVEAILLSILCIDNGDLSMLIVRLIWTGIAFVFRDHISRRITPIVTDFLSLVANITLDVLGGSTRLSFTFLLIDLGFLLLFLLVCLCGDI
jgi:hypothetical protein